MNDITVDRRTTMVVILRGQEIIARMEPEFAVDLAQNIITQADKVLAHIQDEE